MLSNINFVRQSLETHLFFGRIMKEHSFFLQLGFTPRDASFTQQADNFRREFDRLLRDVICISNGIVSADVLDSGEVVTSYTLKAEMASTFYTNVQIPIELTQREAELMPGNPIRINPMLEQRVFSINQNAICLITRLIQFKATILRNVLSCKMFTINYPLLIEHIMREARLYLEIIQRLQRKEIINIHEEALAQELFWNKIMAEHSKFIRGFLDPSEDELFNIANNFGTLFDELTVEVEESMNNIIPFEKVTEDSLNATKKIRAFKAQATHGLIECEIKSIILPLLGDHTLRESNHYLRLLKIFEK